jgi:hypothetical protein
MDFVLNSKHFSFDQSSMVLFKIETENDFHHDIIGTEFKGVYFSHAKEAGITFLRLLTALTCHLVAKLTVQIDR